MAKLDILTYGFAFMSDQGALGYSTVSLLEVEDRRILIEEAAGITGLHSRRHEC